MIISREQLLKDWRFCNQDQYIKGKEVKKSLYNSNDGDHSHCIFCWAKFSCRPQDLHQGYCTEDRRYWICENCFNDFRYILNLNLIE